MQYNIQINYDRNEYVTRQSDPNDEWDYDDTAATYKVNSIELTNGNQYYDITVDFEIVPDKDYYLVYADYGTGDSFSVNDNQLEFIDLFETHEKAKECVKSLNNKNRDYKRTYTRNNGQEITVSIPWEGYFDHLNTIDIVIVRLVNKD